MIPGVWPLILLLGFLFAGSAWAEGVTGAQQVQGTDSTGNESRAFPIVVGGRDSNGDLRPLLTDEEGNLQCESTGSSTVAISQTGNENAVDVLTLPALAAGSATIGNVGVVSGPPASTIDTAATAQAADFTVETGVTNMRLLGYTIRESAASAAVATVVLRNDDDGTCDGTGVVDFIELAANESLRVNHGPRGLALGVGGLCADVLAGTVDFGAFFVTE